MHPEFQQRVEGLQALRMRRTIAIGEFYTMIGKEPPADPIRYQVTGQGKDMFVVKHVASGKTVGFSCTYAKAIEKARELESKADGIKISFSRAVRQ